MEYRLNQLLEDEDAQPHVIFHMIDIDHFKSFNDKYGHDVGDEVLALFTRNILSRCRKDELFLLFGGDELCLIQFIPGNVNRQKIRHIAKRTASRILERTRKMRINVGGKIRSIHASIGTKYSVISEKDVRTKNGPITFIKKMQKDADAALYFSKDRGRNRATLFNDKEKEVREQEKARGNKK